MAQGLVQKCDFAVGDTIAGGYQVCSVLGEGSFGKVFAVENSSHELQALKLLKLWEVPSEIRASLIARFDMEFETGRIQNRYLVHSIGHGLTKGNPYIVMEYCSGGDLMQAVQRERVDLSKAATHILLGLKALHQCGKVHRDLKPENVLVRQNGDFALTDFGISGDRNKRMTERNIVGKPKQIFGTYAYMPPEQVNPRKDATVLPTTDIFSFGVMMYQLITEKLPFGPLSCDRDLITYLRSSKAGQWDRSGLCQSPGGREWMPLMEGCLKPDFKERLQDIDAVLPLVPGAWKPERAADVQREQDKAEDFSRRIVNGVLLRIMQGEDYGRVYRLDDMLVGSKAVLSLGRRDEGVFNDIAITEQNSSYISRKHCTLELDYEQGCWVIRDGQWDRTYTGGWKRSTNGTYVNSKEVTVAGLPFAPGDIISVGDTKLRAEGY